MPFESLGEVSYSPSIVTMAIFCIVCEIDLLVENREFFLPHLYLAPRRGWPVWILGKCLMLVKLAWLGYRIVKKLWRYVKPFSSNTGTLWTDGRTELLCQYSASVLTRDKNGSCDASRRWNSSMACLVVSILYANVTDGRTDTWQWRRLRFCIASHSRQVALLSQRGRAMLRVCQ